MDKQTDEQVAQYSTRLFLSYSTHCAGINGSGATLSRLSPHRLLLLGPSPKNHAAIFDVATWKWKMEALPHDFSHQGVFNHRVVEVRSGDSGDSGDSGNGGDRSTIHLGIGGCLDLKAEDYSPNLIVFVYNW